MTKVVFKKNLKSKSDPEKYIIGFKTEDKKTFKKYLQVVFRLLFIRFV